MYINYKLQYQYIHFTIVRNFAGKFQSFVFLLFINGDYYLLMLNVSRAVKNFNN